MQTPNLSAQKDKPQQQEPQEPTWGPAVQEAPTSPLVAMSDLRLMVPRNLGKSLPTRELIRLLSPVALGHPL